MFLLCLCTFNSFVHFLKGQRQLLTPCPVVFAKFCFMLLFLLLASITGCCISMLFVNRLPSLCLLLHTSAPTTPDLSFQLCPSVLVPPSGYLWFSLCAAFCPLLPLLPLLSPSAVVWTALTVVTPEDPAALTLILLPPLLPPLLHTTSSTTTPGTATAAPRCPSRPRRASPASLRTTRDSRRRRTTSTPPLSRPRPCRLKPRYARKHLTPVLASLSRSWPQNRKHQELPF